MTTIHMLPHEWKAAGSSLRDIQAEVKRHREEWRQIAMGFALPMAGGALLGWWLLPKAVNTAVSSDSAASLLAVAAGLLAFSAILIGFVVTLMLATGRVEISKEVQYEEVVQIVGRTKYLLYSQAVTLFAAIILCGLVVIWSLMVAGKFDVVWVKIIGSVAAGFTGLCLVRSLLLPLQIWELHSAGLDYLLRKQRRGSDSRF